MNDVVTRLARELAYRHSRETGRQYLLTSGQRSDEYLDIKATMLHPIGRDSLVDELAKKVIARYGPLLAVAGVEVGGALLACLVGQRLSVPSLLIRKDNRTRGATEHGIDGLANLKSHHGPRYGIWLVEDVITTGGSTLAALDKLKKVEHDLIGVVCVVDREQGGLEKVKDAVAKDVPVVALTTLSAIRGCSLGGEPK